MRPTTRRYGTTLGDIRHSIARHFVSGQRFAPAVCGHSGIEDFLQWVLDVPFNED